ncbi:adipokinetic hormone/corazonin-related peptide-like [Culicoides brevitarsis]|uniref:adipokinetic hormone/corazonin-related peptide-like n=1 Tax=Culicoides brevitarsis TaxID=469753 RepID=UPI00307B89E6
MGLSQGLSLIFAILLVFAIISPFINGQVTFSRDWNAGKRSIDGVTNECSTLYRSVVSMCNAIFKNIQSNRLHGANEDMESPTVFGSRI